MLTHIVKFETASPHTFDNIALTKGSGLISMVFRPFDKCIQMHFFILAHPSSISRKVNHIEMEPHFLRMESFHHAPIFHKNLNSRLLTCYTLAKPSQCKLSLMTSLTQSKKRWVKLPEWLKINFLSTLC